MRPGGIAILAGRAARRAKDRLWSERLGGVERPAEGQEQGLQRKSIGDHSRDGGVFPTSSGALACHGRDTGPFGLFRQCRKKVL